MKRSIRTIAAILALSLMAGVLCACSTEQSPSNATAQASANQNTTADQQARSHEYGVYQLPEAN